MIGPDRQGFLNSIIVSIQEKELSNEEIDYMINALKEMKPPCQRGLNRHYVGSK